MRSTRLRSMTLRVRGSLREPCLPSEGFQAQLSHRYHAWESKARKYLSALDPTTITAIDTSFTRMARAYREPGEQARWRAARELDGSGSGAGVTPAFEEGEEEEIGQFKRTIRYSREHNR